MRSVLLLCLGALALTAAAPRPAIQVENAQVRIPAGGLPSTTGYMVVKNPGGRPDRLVGAACACAQAVSLHESVTRNGVARMLDLEAVDIPAGGEAAFTSGGRHLMFTGLKQPLKPGDRLAVTLSFERAGQVAATFVADPMAGMEGMAGMHHH